MRDFCPDMIIVKVNMQHNKDGNEFDIVHMIIYTIVFEEIFLYIRIKKLKTKRKSIAIVQINFLAHN